MQQDWKIWTCFYLISRRERKYLMIIDMYELICLVFIPIDDLLHDSMDAQSLDLFVGSQDFFVANILTTNLYFKNSNIYLCFSKQLDQKKSTFAPSPCSSTFSSPASVSGLQTHAHAHENPFPHSHLHGHVLFVSVSVSTPRLPSQSTATLFSFVVAPHAFPHLPLLLPPNIWAEHTRRRGICRLRRFKNHSRLKR